MRVAIENIDSSAMEYIHEDIHKLLNMKGVEHYSVVSGSLSGTCTVTFTIKDTHKFPMSLGVCVFKSHILVTTLYDDVNIGLSILDYERVVII